MKKIAKRDKKAPAKKAIKIQEEIGNLEFSEDGVDCTMFAKRLRVSRFAPIVEAAADLEPGRMIRVEVPAKYKVTTFRTYLSAHMRKKLPEAGLRCRVIVGSNGVPEAVAVVCPTV